MSTPRRLAAPLILLFTASTHGFAADQQHIVQPGQIAAAIDQHLSAQDADRSAMREALGRPEVREAAAKMGLDLTRATAAVEAMEGPDLARAGEIARQVNHQLVGGASTITITTTTLIIILLLAILLIVALK